MTKFLDDIQKLNIFSRFRTIILDVIFEAF